MCIRDRYNITRTELKRFEQAAKEQRRHGSPEGVDPRIGKAMVDGLAHSEAARRAPRPVRAADSALGVESLLRSRRRAPPGDRRRARHGRARDDQLRGVGLSVDEQEGDTSRDRATEMTGIT